MSSPPTNPFIKPLKPPMVSNGMAKAVSQYRRGTLEEEVRQGKFRDGNGGGSNENGLTSASFLTASSGFNKSAQAASSSPGSQWRGSSENTVKQAPAVYSPLWLNSNLNLPRDRATINAWLRSFYALKPFVQNAINLHSTYPISKLSIKCSNKKVEQFFNDMIEEIDLMNVCNQVAQEFWLLGEAFIYAELDDRSAKWSRLIIQNPDYVVVKKSTIANEPLIMLRPDENLRKIVFSNRPSDIAQRKTLNNTIIEHVKRGENIPLDNFYVSHIARRISPYEIRGTGLPVCCFRELMLTDWIREAKFVQAQEMINPLTIVKVGTDGPDGLHPSAADLEAWRSVFESAQYDPNFKIFTHAGVQVERVGYNQGILDTSNDITQLLKEIYMGLMVPSVIMEGGGEITYANGSISLDVLRSRYMAFRNMMSSWLRKKIFAPISKLNEFYEYENGEKKLIIPDIEWNHMSLFDSGDYINVLVQLTTGEQKKVSQHTLYKSLGLDFEDERRKIKKENIADAIHKKELAALERMSLNEVKTLKDDDDIPEVIETANDFDSPYSGGGSAGGGLPGAENNMSLPGMGGDLNAMPPPPPAPGASPKL